jgi:hypothetical protein
MFGVAVYYAIEAENLPAAAGIAIAAICYMIGLSRPG